jgi:hypothetical protein
MADQMPWRALQVRKKILQDRKMDGTALVDEAAQWAGELTRREARGPGDMENAWRRLEARYGVPWRTFWSLRYRKPRELGASIYQRLSAAYNAERERQVRLLRHDIETTKKIAGTSHAAVVAAEAALGAAVGEDE